MNIVIKSNFGGILSEIEEKTGLRISTKSFSRSMPIGDTQARNLREDKTKRYDAETLAKFVAFCARLGHKITPNDVFQFETIEEEMK